MSDNVTPLRVAARPCAPTRFKQSELVRNQWTIYVPESDKLEDVLEPGYWQHIAANLRAGDHIECVWDDSSLHAELFVITAARLHATVAVISQTDLSGASKASEAASENLKIKFRGPYHKYCVMDGSQVLQSGFATDDAANAWLSDYRKNTLKVG